MLFGVYADILRRQRRALWNSSVPRFDSTQSSGCPWRRRRQVGWKMCWRWVAATESFKEGHHIFFLGKLLSLEEIHVTFWKFKVVLRMFVGEVGAIDMWAVEASRIHIVIHQRRRFILQSQVATPKIMGRAVRLQLCQGAYFILRVTVVLSWGLNLVACRMSDFFSGDWISLTFKCR